MCRQTKTPLALRFALAWAMACLMAIGCATSQEQQAPATNSVAYATPPTIAPKPLAAKTPAPAPPANALPSAVVQASGVQQVVATINMPQLGKINPAAAALRPAAVSFVSTRDAIPPADTGFPPEPALPEAIDRGATPIDMVTALAMTDAQNPQVALARARINEASWQLRRANILWLPSIRAGGNYNKHEGQIQDVAGNVFPTSRGALYGGLGANAVGAASPGVPGLYLNIPTADAVFQPKIAQQVVCARNFAAQAQANDSLLQTALAYIELLRAEQELAIARETVEHSQALAQVTRSFAQTGQGLQSDDDRAQTELALRQSDLLRAEEAVTVAGARLAQQIRFDPSQPLAPNEEVIVPIELVPEGSPLAELVAQGLTNRPEIGESRYLIGEAVERLRREQYAPLMPSVLLGVSYGGFGGGLGGNINNFANRLDADAIAYWEVRQFGFGEAAIRNESRARIDQARFREVAQLDRVAREVVEAHAQVTARRRQIDFAQRSIETAQSSYERNLQRIKNVQGFPIEALQAVQALAAARREYLRAVADYNVAQFQLLHNLGGTSGQLIATAGQAGR
jgi:outer membrane protein TolC